MTVSPAATSKMRKNTNLLNKLGVIKEKMINSGGKHSSVSSLNDHAWGVYQSNLSLFAKTYSSLSLQLRLGSKTASHPHSQG
jgi:hypothetical protein